MLKKALPLVLASVIAACQSAPSAGPATTPYLSGTTDGSASILGATVTVQIDTGATLTTLAAKKTTADIDHYHLKLVDANTGVVIAEGDSNNLTSHFNNVPNGTYLLIADAIDADGNSIVQGGEQTSINTVTVNSPNVTYSDGSPCLKVTLHLLDATGETVGNKVHVIDGQDWTGPANLVDGGDCPCPTASSDVTPLADEDRVGGPGVFGPDGASDYHYRVNLGLSSDTQIKSIEIYQSFSPLHAWSTSIGSWSPIVVFQDGIQRNYTYLSEFGAVGNPVWDVYFNKWATPNLLRITLSDGQIIDKPFASVVQ